MASNRIINVGLVGMGTVGTGVAKMLTEFTGELDRKLDFPLRLRKVADKYFTHRDKVQLDDSVCTMDSNDILNDPEIDIVVELAGGTGFASQLIMAALEKGKHVVTANKALLAEKGETIFTAASSRGLHVGYEASVAGAIPVIRVIKESLAGDRVQSVLGIINGTCNYILTRMAEEGKGFAEVLKDAQAKGFAEADPTLDIEGIDAAHKLAILTSLAFGTNIDFSKVYHEGITRITSVDIAFADDFGYCIKLVGITKMTDGRIESRMHPTLIPKDHPLASVRMENNAVFVKGEACGPLLLYGKGAGMMPTASAVVGDIITIARSIMNGGAGSVPDRGYLPGAMKPLETLPMSEVRTRYYIRNTVADRPGVLATIAGILGRNAISIDSVIQKGRSESGDGVPLVIKTHETTEAAFMTAIGEIERQDFCLDKPFFIRIEENI